MAYRIIELFLDKTIELVLGALDRVISIFDHNETKGGEKWVKLN